MSDARLDSLCGVEKLLESLGYHAGDKNLVDLNGESVQGDGESTQDCRGVAFLATDDVVGRVS